MPGVELDPLQMPQPVAGQLRMQPRSKAQLFYYLTNGVKVPCEHVDVGIIRPEVGPGGEPFDSGSVTEGHLAAHACKGLKPPGTTLVAVKYRGFWYYIDVSDQASKVAFDLVEQLSRPDFFRRQANGPFLTLTIGS